MKTYIRFYEELNDHLSVNQKKKELLYEVNQNTTVKDAIESFGVSHAEVDLILVNGDSRPFSYILKDQDRVSVFPMFESMDITSLTLVRNQPLRERRKQPLAFVVDVNLGKLAHFMRMLGFDVLYDISLHDDELLAKLSKEQNRILLTRDRGLLKRRNIDHGYFVRSTRPTTQTIEVLKRFDMMNLVNLCSRCLHCNNPLQSISKEQVLQELPPQVAEGYQTFYFCPHCERIYWEGTHFEHMRSMYHHLQQEYAREHFLAG
jgi:uncharacterized protein with PIN domain/sulfur carrier protein ThiS